MITDFEVIKKRYIWDLERYIGDLINFKVIKFDSHTVNFIKAELFILIDVLYLIFDSHNG